MKNYERTYEIPHEVAGCADNPKIKISNTEKSRTHSGRNKYKSKYKQTILRLLHMCGVINNDMLSFLPNREMYIRAITALKKDGLVETKRIGRHGPWQVYLKNYSCTCEEYIGYLPEGYREFYENTMINDARAAKGKDTYGLKVLKTSDTEILMYACGISVFLEEKPSISKSDVPISSSKSYFYTSRDIKHCYGYVATLDTSKYGKTIVHNSRLIGCLLSNGNAYAVYNTGNTLMKWSYTGEMQMARYLSMIFRKKYQGYIDEKQRLEEAIILSWDTKCFLQILESPYNPALTKRRLINIEDFTYDSMYAIPINQDGRRMLEIMKRKGWKQELKSNLLSQESMKSAEAQSLVMCDGYEKETYLLIFCIPDMSKLKSFLVQAQKYEDKSRFSIYCFTFQNEIIVKLAKDICNIYNIELEEYYQKIVVGTELL